jgi:hypothetical protein
MSYAVQVKVGGEFTNHSTHDSYRDAVDQADMVHGRVVVAATGLTDRKAWSYAVAEQGFAGDFSEWQSMDDEERSEYETGAGA